MNIKKILSVGLFPVFMLSVFAYSIPQVFAATLSVNNAGGSSCVDNSASSTYCTIQAAINVAQPGDTILVNGTFGDTNTYTAYNVTSSNVTISGVSGNAIYGTFNLYGDGDTLNSVNVYSRGGGGDSLKNAVNVVSNSVNIINSTFELADPNAVAAGGGVGNGVVIWPYGTATSSLNITGNTFVGFGATVPNWSSTSLLIAENIDLARVGMSGHSSIPITVDDHALATNNTFTGNSYDYVHQNWAVPLGGGGEWLYSKVSNPAGLMDAITDSASGATVLVGAGTYNLDSQIRITSGLTITGAGDSTIITKSSSTAWTNSTGEKGWAPLITIIGVSDPVVLSDFEVTGAANIGNDYGHGINVVSSSRVTLTNITSVNNAAAGLIVNGSTVTANNLNTSGNAWGAVNVDPGSGVTTPSVFTLSSSTLAEGTQIWSDGSNVNSGATVTVNAAGYTMYKVASTTAGFIWTNKSGKGATITSGGVSTYYSTIQAAIDAASTSTPDTINVGPGVYDESLNITTPVTLQSTGGRDVTTVNSLTIATSSVTVSGFTIEGVNTSGVASTNIFLNSGVSTTTISTNKIINIGSGVDTVGGDSGIGLLTTSNLGDIGDNLNVTGNIFQATTTGSNRAFYINPGINHFTFSGNTITGDFTGTSITQAENGLVENNTVTGAGAAGSRSAGLGTWGSPDPTVWGHTTFSGNTISGTAKAIAIYETNNVTTTGNTLSGNGTGIWVGVATPLSFNLSTISVSKNDLSNEDTFGVTNATTTSLDASDNYWGIASSTEIAAKISGPVNYTPWYTDSAMTTLSNDASVTSTAYTVSALTNSTGTITNVPFGTSSSTFLADLTPAIGASVSSTASTLADSVVSGNALVVVSADGSTTGTYTVTVNAAPVTTYTLTYTAGANGTITGTSTQTVDAGADGSAVTAVPNSGYQFSSWSDNGSTVASRTDTDVTADVNAMANFTAIPVVSSGGGGGGGGGSAQANIGITSAVDNGSPTTGSTIHYTLTVSATGPSTSFGIVANDVLPAGLTFVSASSSEGSYNSSTGVWTIGSLNIGQTATLTIAATVTASTGTAITNTATVSESSAVINSNTANDSSSVTVNVGGTSTGQVLGASTTGGGNVGQVLGASTTNTVALLQELQNLEQQLVTLEFKANSCSFTFNANLSKGMTSSEVQNLQKVLNYSSLTQVAATGVGSPNNETTYFGSATKNAVIAFQNIFANQILTPNGLTSGNGYVGASTRSVLNGLCGH